MSDYVNIWIIGAGEMARSYIPVLKEMKEPFCVVGRSEQRAKSLGLECNVDVLFGGIEEVLKSQKAPERAIVCVGVPDLERVALALLNAGVKRLLIEKPGALTLAGLKRISELRHLKNASVEIAYNRRFYTSVMRCEEMIAEDGGLVHIEFEFTEWIDRLPLNKFPQEELNRLLITNSTHVIDTAFCLAGRPVELNARVQGALPWHPAGAFFSGSGLTDRDVLFTYKALWGAPGRWGIVCVTPKRALILKPLEALQVMLLGQVQTAFVPLEDDLDRRFKPGIYRQVESFLKRDTLRLCSLEEHIRNWTAYEKIAGYPSS